MNQVLFHIGYHKSGTSWLQQELFNSTSKNFVPLSINIKGNRALVKDFIYDKEGYLLSSFDNNEQTILKDYLDSSNSLKTEEKRIPVISHERLSGSPFGSGFDSSLILQRIKNTFPDSKILIVIREQKSWILSYYFQYLKIGGTHSLKNYLNIKYDGKVPGFSPSHIKYHLLIKDYFAKFGENNVLALPYELMDSDKSAFIKRIGDFLKVDLSNETANFDKRVNVRSDHYLNYKLRFLNPLIRSTSLNNNSSLFNKNRQQKINRLKNIISPYISIQKNESIKEKLRKEIKEWTGDRFNLSNQITQELIKINLEDYGYQTNTNKI